jgi:RNA-splicing ligase RtcB
MIFKGKYTIAETKTDLLEESLVSQIHKFINNPVFKNPIKIMPDCHAGVGSCVGFTMEMGDKINPQTIGVDIGCGMLSVKMGFDITDEMSYSEIDRKIREVVPMGFDVNENDENFKAYFNFKEISKRLKRNYDSRDFFGKILANKKIRNRVKNSIGSLGGGNHFIEIGVDEEGYFWITVHTGSRNFGKVVCDYYTDLAKKYASDSYDEKYKSAVEKIKSDFPKNEWEDEIKKISIPKANEFYLEGKL